MSTRLFPDNVPTTEWQTFKVDGLSRDACGIVFPAGEASCGIPLGGVGTGCMDLDTDATFGRASVFNSFVPPRVLGVPFLYVSAAEQLHCLSTRAREGSVPAQGVSYFGHYPVADLEFDLAAPFSAGLRAWSAFVPGDAARSNTPGAVFEVRLRNESDATLDGELMFSFPGPDDNEATGQVELREIDGPFRGVEVVSDSGVEYALGVIREENLSITCDDVPPCDSLPSGDAVATVRVPFELSPGESTVVRFVLSWYAPRWVGNDEHHYWHAYRDRFDDAAEVARFLAEEHVGLLESILAWQDVIYGEEALPVWLRDQLLNVLHTIPEDSFWASNSIPAEDWCGKDGFFGLTESPRTTPHVAIPSDFYGSLPLVFFFPNLMRSLLRAYVHFQLPNGEIPLGIGSGADMQSPIYHCLHTTNGCTFVDLVHRLWKRDHDEGVLREFFPAVKKAIDYGKSLDHDGDGLLDLEPDPGGNQFYGAWLWYGTATHPDGFWLAALKMGREMAEAIGDRAFANDCRIWFSTGSRSLEEKLWNGDSYLLYHDTETGKKSDTVLANQLAGQWLARLHGLEDVFPAARVKTVLETVKRKNLPASEWGAMNAIRPDGSVDESGPAHSTEIFAAENLAVAMTLMYHGDVDTGKELAHRVMNNVVLRQRVPWDMPNMFEPENGTITHGTDFYQMMMQWGIPLALAGESIADVCAPGGLVARIVEAAGSR
jgi:uncharacterized protein (DUF608 family)